MTKKVCLIGNFGRNIHRMYGLKGYFKTQGIEALISVSQSRRSTAPGEFNTSIPPYEIRRLEREGALGYRRLIEQSVAVYMVDEGGCFGTSTCGDMSYAQAKRKPVFAEVVPREEDIATIIDGVLSPSELAKWVNQGYSRTHIVIPVAVPNVQDVSAYNPRLISAEAPFSKSSRPFIKRFLNLGNLLFRDVEGMHLVIDENFHGWERDFLTHEWIRREKRRGKLATHTTDFEDWKKTFKAIYSIYRSILNDPIAEISHYGYGTDSLGELSFLYSDQLFKKVGTFFFNGRFVVSGIGLPKGKEGLLYDGRFINRLRTSKDASPLLRDAVLDLVKEKNIVVT